MKINPVEAELFHAQGKKSVQTDRRKYITKLKESIFAILQTWLENTKGAWGVKS